MCDSVKAMADALLLLLLLLLLLSCPACTITTAPGARAQYPMLVKAASLCVLRRPTPPPTTHTASDVTVERLQVLQW